MDTKRTELLIRHFAPLYTDEPEVFGGRNLSPTPLEMLLGALCGCTVTTLITIAQEMGLDVEGIEVDARGHADGDAIMGRNDGRPDFHTVLMQVKIVSNESEDRIENLKQHMERRCPLFNLFVRAQADIKHQWQIIRSH